MTTMRASGIVDSQLFGFVKHYGLADAKTEVADDNVMRGDLKRAVKGLSAAASKEYLNGPATLQVAQVENDVDIQFRFPAQTFGYRSAKQAIEELQLSLAA